MKRKLLAWYRWVNAYGKSQAYVFKPMISTAKSIVNHLDAIIIFAQSRVTNAFMEWLNSIFSAVKRKARGFRYNQYLICMLYFIAGKLKINYFI